MQEGGGREVEVVGGLTRRNDAQIRHRPPESRLEDKVRAREEGGEAILVV